MTTEKPETVAVGSDGLLAEASYVVENLREWAREEFQPNCHPVTLTLYRAATVLDKLSSALKREQAQFAPLHMSIGRYRAALDDIAELSESGDASSHRDFGDIARTALTEGAKLQTANKD